MARRTQTTVPQPPWVWSPSEVNKYIRGAYPSKKRTHKEERKGSETVPRLHFVVLESDEDRVREVLAEGLGAIGVTVADERPSKAGARKHVAAVSVRRALLRSKVRVSVEFDPPIHPSSCAKLLARLSRSLHLADVDEEEERPVLPRKSR